MCGRTVSKLIVLLSMGEGDYLQEQEPFQGRQFGQIFGRKMWSHERQRVGFLDSLGRANRGRKLGQWPLCNCVIPMTPLRATIC